MPPPSGGSLGYPKGEALEASRKAGLSGACCPPCEVLRVSHPHFPADKPDGYLGDSAGLGFPPNQVAGWRVAHQGVGPKRALSPLPRFPLQHPYGVSLCSDLRAP